MSAGRRLAYLAAAAICSFAPAQAHTGEAVADAEALLKTTMERAKTRQASAQDVSIVRYHLLEMKAAAGLLSPEAFCREAREELQTMAAAEGDEPVKAELGLRGGKIDAMQNSPELCRQATADVDAYLFGADQPAKTDDEVHEAERAAAEATKRYKAGDLDRTSTTLAEIAALEAPYTAGKIARQAYCASGQGALLADLAGWAQTLAQAGQMGLLGQIAVRRRLYQFKALCTPK
jgi:hypothetical protein